MSLVRFLFVLLLTSAWTGCTTGSDVSRIIGARCQSHDDCNDVCLADPDYPDGMCSQNCNAPRDCPSGATCIDSGQGVCLYRCLEPADCDFLGAGWQCASVATLPSGQESVCTGP